MARLRIMTFNVRGDYDDGANRWEFRSGLNVRTIARHSPDVVGFQEAQGVHLETYRRELAWYEIERGVAYNNADPYAYNAVAWRAETFETVDRGGFWLSETPGEMGLGWDAACIRSANWVRLAGRGEPAGSPTGLLCNTHLDHRGETARVEGAGLVVERLAGLRRGEEPVIVTGDMNCRPGSPVIDVFTSAGYVDLYAASGAQEAGTFHGFTGEASAAHGRIDWVLMLPGGPALRPVSAEVIRDAEPPLYPSDHFPLVVDLET